MLINPGLMFFTAELKNHHMVRQCNKLRSANPSHKLKMANHHKGLHLKLEGNGSSKGRGDSNSSASRNLHRNRKHRSLCHRGIAKPPQLKLIQGPSVCLEAGQSLWTFDVQASVWPAASCKRALRHCILLLGSKRSTLQRWELTLPE